MSLTFISEFSLQSISWQAFERIVCRLLILEGYKGVRLVGQTSDRGADIIAHKYGKRWLFQIKHWQNKIGLTVLDETISALRVYRADIPVIVALNGFNDLAMEHQRTLLSRGIAMQFWDRVELLRRVNSLDHHSILEIKPRAYQEDAIKSIVKAWQSNIQRKAIIVMATGLGKTFTAAEAIRRINSIRPQKVLVLAHTNEIVYQLERAFWPLLKPIQETVVWNGYEQPSPETLERASFVFACVNSVSANIENRCFLPEFDIIIIDECHHVGGDMYKRIVKETSAGSNGGPFLLGLTATPWRPDETDLSNYFGDTIYSIDMVTGLRLGFLANVDYRMYTDNIDWSALQNFQGTSLTPRQINRTLFISEWDNAVVGEFQKAWSEIAKPRAIIFCGTIDHAITMRDQINGLGFCNAAAIYSRTQGGQNIPAWERNRILSDFTDGTINVICTVDIFNEGVDVPDVNLIVFQRVTHSRRIFIQQLGRGLRLADGKTKVIILDFVSDIRRFAAGINLKDKLDEYESVGLQRPIRIRIQHTVKFQRAGMDDPTSESFLREWLEDVASIENSGEDASVLKYPPSVLGSKQ